MEIVIDIPNFKWLENEEDFKTAVKEYEQGEAIKHCEEVAEKNEKECKNWTYGASQIDDESRKKQYLKHAEMWHECATEHRQIAEWLKELKYYKDRQDLINKNWQELIRYKDGIEKIKMRSQAYRECGESILASGMEQALDILEEVKVDEDSD